MDPLPPNPLQAQINANANGNGTFPLRILSELKRRELTGTVTSRAAIKNYLENHRNPDAVQPSVIIPDYIQTVTAQAAVAALEEMNINNGFMETNEVLDLFGVM